VFFFCASAPSLHCYRHHFFEFSCALSCLCCLLHYGADKVLLKGLCPECSTLEAFVGHTRIAPEVLIGPDCSSYLKRLRGQVPCRFAPPPLLRGHACFASPWNLPLKLFHHSCSCVRMWCVWQDLELAVDGERRSAEDARQAAALLERKRIALQTELEDVRAALDAVSNSLLVWPHAQRDNCHQCVHLCSASPVDPPVRWVASTVRTKCL